MEAYKDTRPIWISKVVYRFFFLNWSIKRGKVELFDPDIKQNYLLKVMHITKDEFHSVAGWWTPILRVCHFFSIKYQCSFSFLPYTLQVTIFCLYEWQYKRKLGHQQCFKLKYYISACNNVVDHTLPSMLKWYFTYFKSSLIIVTKHVQHKSTRVTKLHLVKLYELKSILLLRRNKQL